MKKIISLFLLLFIFTTGFSQTYPNSYTDGKLVNVNGANLYVVTVGKGNPLIIIPGGPGGTHLGYRDFDALAKDNQIIYFDGFGRGKSDTAKVVTDYSLARDIEDIEGLRKALHLNKINVLGHSYGGLVAQGYAIKYPQNVNHLILADTFHSYLMWQKNDDNSNHEIKTNYPEVWNALMKIRKKGAVSSDLEHQKLYAEVPYGFLYAYNPDNFLPKNRKPYPNSFNSKLYYQMVGRDGDFIVGSDIGSFDFRKDLKNLKMPILIYGGRFDRVAVPSEMVKYKEFCPQAKFVMFEKSGHNPQVEEPEKLFKLIEEFLH